MDLKEAISRIRGEARELQERLDKLNFTIETMQKLAAENSKPKRSRTAGDSHSTRVRRSIASMLLENAEGVHRKELMERLREGGVYPGEDLEKEMRNLSSQLSDDERFIKVDDSGSGYWTFTEDAWEELAGQTRARESRAVEDRTKPIVVHPTSVAIMPERDDEIDPDDIPF